MSLEDIIIKILFFFAVFYGAVAITTFVSKRFKLDEKANPKEEHKEEKEKSSSTKE